MKHGIRRFLSAKSGIMAIIQTAFANLAVQGVNLLCGILTARSLGPDGRGLLAGVIMWPQFLAYGMTIGIPIASVPVRTAFATRSGPGLVRALKRMAAAELVYALLMTLGLLLS